MQPCDILISFILYYFWNERCHLKFEGSYYSSKVLWLVWISIVKVGMVFRHVLNSHMLHCMENYQVQKMFVCTFPLSLEGILAIYF